MALGSSIFTSDLQSLNTPEPSFLTVDGSVMSVRLAQSAKSCGASSPRPFGSSMVVRLEHSHQYHHSRLQFLKSESRETGRLEKLPSVCYRPESVRDLFSVLQRHRYPSYGKQRSLRSVPEHSSDRQLFARPQLIILIKSRNSHEIT